MNIVLNPPTNTKMDRMGEEVGKIFVGGVSRETTIDAFRAYFESFGQINDIVLMMDKDTRMNKGYGFVKFDDPRCSEDVLAKKGQHKLDGKMLDTKPCNARGSKPRGGGGPDDSRTKKVFVGGISQQASKDDLYELFKQFGMVEDVHIMTDNETGKHRGFGFVTLESEEDVEKLVRMQHLELKGKSMEIKKAQPKMNRGFGGPGGPGSMGGGGFQQGGSNFNQGGQPGGYGGYGGSNQWNMGQPMSQFGQQQGGYQQRSGAGQAYGGQQQGYNNGYRQQGQGGAGYGQQGGGYGQQQQQQQQQQTQQQQSYGGKPNAEGDNYGRKSSRNGGQSYSGYGGYGQTQQDPYGQQQQTPQQTQQQYGNQGSMGSYAQEASGYGPQRVNYSQQQGYSQGQFGNDMPGQNYGPPQQQQQQQPPQLPQQQQPHQGYGQQVEGGPDMYSNNNYGRGNLGGGNQFHPYRRFQGNQVQ